MYLSRRHLAILGFIVIGIVSRLMPHPPNFTAINAIALYSVLCFGNRWLSLATLFLTLFFSDLIFGSHPTMPYVYLSFSLIVELGYRLRGKMSLRSIGVCFAASLLFFLVTNFGEWLTGSLYSKTLSGLGLCYLAALPFLGNQILGDFVYGILCFGYVHLYKSDFFAVQWRKVSTFLHSNAK